MTVLRAMESEQRASDVILIVRSHADPEVFGEIYDRYAVDVHRYLTRRIGSALADDLTADTFLAAFRNRHRFDPAAERALPWLYGIATNLLHRHVRTERAQYRRWARTGADPTVADDHAEAVAVAVSAEATVRGLSRALAGLTTRERDVVLLIVWAALTYEETATALGIPIGTVRSRMNRAHQRLRGALAGPSFNEES